MHVASPYSANSCIHQEYTLAYTDSDIMDIGELTVKCNLDLLIDFDVVNHCNFPEG